ncbi:tRNA uridine-5-carboxymethylaminomethyl(34) synthesis GTPase MnmE [bacterium]|nr:tRNA uridine-5-carboxymethylaminomethyl(34) synthesis GTPase MnmE [bacterium]
MDDVIVAIATPAGVGALSIVRLSGKGVFSVVKSFFNKSLEDKESHTAHFGKILDKNGATIDEVVILIMRGKTSFTGENSIEIICHGNPLIAKKIVRRALDCGARSAEPGEFSKRAFLHGKVDLVQVEAIKEMIHAKNEKALAEASRQLSGSLSIYIKDLQTCFIDILSVLEVHIDYPEEGIEEAAKAELLSMIEITMSKIMRLLSTFDDGKKMFTGHSIAIIGAPNAGKSSLLNALLEENRAIVTNVAGTTRDTIEEEMEVDGHLLKIIDTAGIRKSRDSIEIMGMERSLQMHKNADLSILLVDLTENIPEEVTQLYHQNKNLLVVYNKQDLAKPLNPLNCDNPIYISAKEKKGLESLKKALIEKLSFSTNDNTPLLTKERHFAALSKAKKSLEEVSLKMEQEVEVELLSFDLREGLESLSEIIGIDVTEKILGGIFSKFCVGK